MIMNTLVVDREEVANRFNESFLHYLLDTKSDVGIREFAMDLKQHAEDIQNLLSDDLGISRKTFKECFLSGHTMMMLDIEEFERLEKWDMNNEDFQVVVFTEDGVPIGCYQKEVVQW